MGKGRGDWLSRSSLSEVCIQTKGSQQLPLSKVKASGILQSGCPPGHPPPPLVSDLPTHCGRLRGESLLVSMSSLRVCVCPLAAFFLTLGFALNFISLLPLWMTPSLLVPWLLTLGSSCRIPAGLFFFFLTFSFILENSCLTMLC